MNLRKEDLRIKRIIFSKTGSLRKECAGDIEPKDFLFVARAEALGSR